MAVINTVVGGRGTIFPNQYCRIEEVQARKTRMFYTVGVHFDQEHANEIPPHRTEVFEGEFDLFSPLNLWQQAYASLKQIWPDATDA